MANVKNYSTDVFINCPFDDEYLPLFHAICFAVHDAGFRARCSLEDMDTGTTRLDKIRNIISECKYSIHDLSRVDSGSKETSLPRFNMSFECGLFFGARYFGNNSDKQKKLLVLDSKQYRYQATISDISGQDISCHSNKPLIVIAKIRSFLSRKEKIGALPGENKMQLRYQAFMKDLPKIAKNAGLTVKELKSLNYWPDIISAMVLWQQNLDK